MNDFSIVRTFAAKNPWLVLVIAALFLLLLFGSYIPLQKARLRYRKLYRELREQADDLLQKENLEPAHMFVVSQAARDLSDTRICLMADLTQGQNSNFTTRHAAYQTAYTRLLGIRDNLDSVEDFLESVSAGSDGPGAGEGAASKEDPRQ